MIWVDDAARAVATALEKAPAGIYDIVEDEPLTRGEMREALAAAAGRKRIVALPVFLVRLSLGKGALFLTRSQRVSNRRFKEATGWAPEVKNSREGWRRIGEAARRD
jgi:nucleoside-diphosphate-sugar epimerase